MNFHCKYQELQANLLRADHLCRHFICFRSRHVTRTKDFRSSKITATVTQIKTFSGEHWPILYVLKHFSLIKHTTMNMMKSGKIVDIL